MPGPQIPAGIRFHFKDVVHIRVKITDDAYGGNIYFGDPKPQKCRINYGDKRIWSTDGEQVVSSVQVLTTDVPGFDAEAEVTMPDGHIAPVRSFARPKWPNGAYSLEIML